MRHAERLLTGIITVCAVVTTGVVVYRAFAPAPTSRSPHHSMHAVDNWQALIAGGHRIGTTKSVVTVVEFGDFECPSCRAFAVRAVKGVLAHHPDDVALIYRYWPLDYHRFAYPAARAAECAAGQGNFEGMYAVLYGKQDSLGLKSFRGFAAEAGVRDLEAFATCDRDTARVPAIDSDAAAAVRLKSIGTPTILIDGRLLNFVPDSGELEDLITKELAKRSK